LGDGDGEADLSAAEVVLAVLLPLPFADLDAASVDFVLPLAVVLVAPEVLPVTLPFAAVALLFPVPVELAGLPSSVMVT